MVPRQTVRLGRGTAQHRGVLYQGNRPGSHGRRAWVVLHGVSCLGAEHPSLVRFASALAGSGATVLIPEVEPWKQLSLDPAPGQQAIRLAVDELTSEEGATRAPSVGLVGFSFGCPQVILAGTDPYIADRISGIVGFGGYGDLEATVHFGLTGQFQAAGATHWLRPDPYGRWIVASNYLPRVPGFESATDVAAALKQLATLAGQRKIMSWDRRYDPAKDEMEVQIAPERRELFRLFAPPADREPDLDYATELAPLIAAAARTTHPDLDPLPTLTQRPPPLRLFHGRQDHLVPYVETLALERNLPDGTDVRVTVTDLFAHSQEHSGAQINVRELMRFYGALRGVMQLPDQWARRHLRSATPQPAEPPPGSPGPGLR